MAPAKSTSPNPKGGKTSGEAPSSPGPPEPPMLGINGNAATKELSLHLEGITSKRDKLKSQIAELDKTRQNLQKDLDAARTRLAAIKEGKTEKAMAETSQVIEEQREQMVWCNEQLRECDQAVGRFKEELMRLFEGVHKKAVEMAKHCKSKDDDVKHTTHIEKGIEHMERELANAKAKCVIKQKKHGLLATLKKHTENEKEAVKRLEELTKLKAEEELEAQRLQDSFAAVDAEMEQLTIIIDKKQAEEDELTGLLLETQEAHRRIMEAASTLLDVSKREQVAIQKTITHGKPKVSQSPKKRSGKRGPMGVAE
eukprot:TRINITY_DN13733_c0_g1_i1.p1 TRINITY_DN13733_c0_g1~~TRINITY_DN13733_c0_g1_i1.p1  ORF type:complete len:312 (-),score=89.89 TRINITY_DN13733_c0_g1_i1:83-1018(-)